MKKAVYAGSFDPFTNGHLGVVKNAADIFDEVYLLICHNTKKSSRMVAPQDMREAIATTLKEAHIDNVIVLICDNELVVDFAQGIGAKYLIRGLRNNMDYNYEENIATINNLLNPDIQSIYFRTENAAISSSMIKDLMLYGKDIRKYVPHNIYECLKKRCKDE